MNANRVRIIGGVWRSRVIRFPAREDLRPTPDRVRETLFNWLGQDLTGKTCLDLFAGSGALGFEAASRGATRVVMVERDGAAFRALEDNARRLGGAALALKRADALEFLRSDDGVYDVVFLDPPFRSNYLPQLLKLVPRRLASEAVVYLEGAGAPELPPDWRLSKHGRAGRVCFQLLKWTRHDTESGLSRNV
ncbi:MAG: 16S rRNA (guanine(966)-N(2))-methyltransferase RsmD [Betaproteobacteria bacterium]|nr:16S rRNA (guanine(966)-N(2))-methyltransferase RsmD [Betaproteobacteria bacterium]